MIGLRRFIDGDEMALLHVFLSSIRGIPSCYYTSEQIAAWAPIDIDQEKWFNHVKKLKPFIAEVAGKIVGYADVQPNGYIDHFFVSNNHQKQGVGTQLMNSIHTEAKQLEIVELTANVSLAAEAFFLQQDFSVLQRCFPIRRGVMLQNTLMRKYLTKK